MAIVATRALTKRFGAGENAVDGVDIETRDGEFLVLLGPSGLRQDDRPADDRGPRGADVG